MTDNTAYTFDFVTREYIYKYERDGDALTTIGNDRTFDEVLPEKEGFARLRSIDNTEWYYVIDLRGQSQYSTNDGAESVIDYAGDLHDGCTLTPRPAPYYVFDLAAGTWVIDIAAEAVYLASLKATKKIDMRVSRDARINKYDAITIDAGVFNVDQVVLAYINGELINAQANGYSDDEIIMTLTTIVLDDVDLTKTQALALSAAKNDIKKRVGAYYNLLIGQINDATTIAEVENITWNDQVRQ